MMISKSKSNKVQENIEKIRVAMAGCCSDPRSKRVNRLLDEIEAELWQS